MAARRSTFINVADAIKLFNDRVELSLGRIAAGDDFLVSVYDYLFMQNGFDGNPVGIFFNSPGMTAYPNATWGGRIKFWSTQRSYVMGGIYNGDPSIRATSNHGADMSLEGPLFAIAEVGYINNGLPGDSQLLGHYKAGAWYDHSSYIDYQTVGYSTPAGMKQGNFGFYGMFDQVLVPFGEPTSNRGLGIFGSALISPCSAGQPARCLIFHRGVACRGFSGSPSPGHHGAGERFLVNSAAIWPTPRSASTWLMPGMGVQKCESVLELTYWFRLGQTARYFHPQPDLQYMSSGRERHRANQ